MNKFKKNTRLFNNLMRISNNDNTLFFFNDSVTRMGKKVRIFSYHAAAYEHWLAKDAIECRGIMFEMDENNKPIRVLARPMEKFFNAFENPIADVKWDDALYYMTKEDGSLISSFDDNGYLGFKSKTSLYSDQAHWAMEWINDHPLLKKRVHELAENDFTVNFEYVGPKNRIILGYLETSMRILNVRNNSTGEYVEMDEIYADPILRPYMVDVFEADCSDEWYEDLRNKEDIEGVVVAFPDKFVKVKTKWYFTKFDALMAVQSNKNLAMYCINNEIDDVRTMYVDDEAATRKIMAFEKMYHDILRSDFDQILTFYNTYRHLDRQTYYRNATINAYRNLHLVDTMMHMYGGFDGENCIKSLTKLYRMHMVEQFIPNEYK